MIPLQFALRRRVMQTPTTKWTLVVTDKMSDVLTVSINGVKLTPGSHAVKDSMIVHFELISGSHSGFTAKMFLNGQVVSSVGGFSVAQYDLGIHSNCTTDVNNGSWNKELYITTQ